ncbi:unnamed protein product [Caenorhabditis nigoni]
MKSSLIEGAGIGGDKGSVSGYFVLESFLHDKNWIPERLAFTSLAKVVLNGWKRGKTEPAQRNPLQGKPFEAVRPGYQYRLWRHHGRSFGIPYDPNQYEDNK